MPYCSLSFVIILVPFPVIEMYHIMISLILQVVYFMTNIATKKDSDITCGRGLDIKLGPTTNHSNM